MHHHASSISWVPPSFDIGKSSFIKFRIIIVIWDHLGGFLCHAWKAHTSLKGPPLPQTQLGSSTYLAADTRKNTQKTATASTIHFFSATKCTHPREFIKTTCQKKTSKTINGNSVWFQHLAPELKTTSRCRHHRKSLLPARYRQLFGWEEDRWVPPQLSSCCASVLWRFFVTYVNMSGFITTDFQTDLL